MSLAAIYLVNRGRAQMLVRSIVYCITVAKIWQTTRMEKYDIENLKNLVNWLYLLNFQSNRLTP